MDVILNYFFFQLSLEFRKCIYFKSHKRSVTDSNRLKSSILVYPCQEKLSFYLVRGTFSNLMLTCHLCQICRDCREKLQTEKRPLHTVPPHVSSRN